MAPMLSRPGGAATLPATGQTRRDLPAWAAVIRSRSLAFASALAAALLGGWLLALGWAGAQDSGGG